MMSQGLRKQPFLTVRFWAQVAVPNQSARTECCWVIENQSTTNNLRSAPWHGIIIKSWTPISKTNHRTPWAIKTIDQCMIALHIQEPWMTPQWRSCPYTRWASRRRSEENTIYWTSRSRIGTKSPKWAPTRAVEWEDWSIQTRVNRRSAWANSVHRSRVPSTTTDVRRLTVPIEILRVTIGQALCWCLSQSGRQRATPTLRSNQITWSRDRKNMIMRCLSPRRG